MGIFPYPRTLDYLAPEDVADFMEEGMEGYQNFRSLPSYERQDILGRVAKTRHSPKSSLDAVKLAIAKEYGFDNIRVSEPTTENWFSSKRDSNTPIKVRVDRFIHMLDR